MIAGLFSGSFNYGTVTQTLGTVITRGIAPMRGNLTRLTTLHYVSLGTAHTLTVLKSLGRTTLAAAAAASQAVVVLRSDPGPSTNLLATSDYCALRQNDGTMLFGTVTWVLGTLTATFGSNLTAAASAGSDFWMFGVAADQTDYTFKPTVSTRTIYSDPISGIMTSGNVDEPLLIYSNNATAAGVIDLAAGYYAKA